MSDGGQSAPATHTSASDDVRADRNEAVPVGQLASLWLAMVAVAIGAFVWAVSQHQLVRGLALLTTAAFCGMVAVFAAIRYVAQEHGEVRTGLWLPWVSGVAAVVSGFVVRFGYGAERQVVTAVGALVLIHAVAFLSDSFNQAVQPRQGAARQTVSVLLANGVMFASTLVVALEGSFTSLAALMTVVWLFALVVLKLTIVQFVVSAGEMREQRTSVTWGTAATALIAGVLALLIGGWFMLVWAGSLLVGGLSAIGLLVHNQVELPRRLGGRELFDTLLELVPDLARSAARSISAPWVGGLLGAALATASFVLLSRLMEGPLAPLAVMVVVMIIGAYFVLPGETVFGAVLLGLLIVWVAEDTDSSSPDERNAAALAQKGSQAQWVVALGDSFISGEGAPVFDAGTNSPGSNDCRRAPTAYPRLVADHLGMPLLSFACSGAEVKHLLDEGQKPASPPETPGALPQLDALTAWLDSAESPAVGVVLVSIGGNDSGFGDVITACLVPGANCADVESAFLERVALLESSLRSVYERIVEIFESRQPSTMPRVMVIPYPDPIGDAGVDCSLVLGAGESSFIRRFRVALNGQVRNAVAAADSIELVASEDSLVGHELCSEVAYVNWLTLSPPDGDFLEAVNPARWINGSLHPGEGGHCVAALLVLDVLDPANAPERFPDCVRPSSAPAMLAAFESTPPELCAATGDEPRVVGEDCTKRWNDAALDGAGRSVMFASALALSAGLLVAGAASAFTPSSMLTGIPARLWSVLRRVWLDYDRVAHGPRATGDVFSTVRVDGESG